MIDRKNKRKVKMIVDKEGVSRNYFDMIWHHESPVMAKIALEDRGYDLHGSDMFHLLILGRDSLSHFGGVLAKSQSHFYNEPKVSAYIGSDYEKNSSKKRMVQDYLAKYHNSNVVLTSPREEKTTAKILEDLGCVVERIYKK